MKNTITQYLTIAIALLFITLPATLSAQKKADFTGRWTGKGTVDYGFGRREEFEYELHLDQNKDGTITGYSVTFLHVDGKIYTAKAAVEGKYSKNYLNCGEKYNITEDKLPNSNWIPFTKMELIWRKQNGSPPTLEGLYECNDKLNGRLILTKKAPQA